MSILDSLKQVISVINNHGFKFEGIIDPEQDIVFISGSRMEGFGNASSDIDLFVVSNFNSPTIYPIITPSDEGYYIDVEVHSFDEISNLYSKVNRASLSNDMDDVLSLNFEDLDLYYRTIIGRPFINPNGYNDLKSKFRKETLSKVYEIRSALESQRELMASEMELLTNGAEAAYFPAQHAVKHAINSYLSAHGECYVSTKWQFEKIARAFGRTSTFYKEAWELQSLGSLDFISYVNAAKNFCSKLGMDRFPKLTTKRVKYISKNPEVYEIETIDHFYLIHDPYVYQLNQQAHYLWSLINDNLDNEGICSIFCKTYNVSRDLAIKFTEKTLNMFLAFGLVKLI